MTTMPTAEQFLAQPSTDEDEPDTDAVPEVAPASDPLSAIAESLRTVVDIFVRRDAEDVADTELEQRYETLDRAYALLEDHDRSLFELLAEIEKIAKPSTSKLANNIRDAIEAWRSAPADAVAVEPEDPAQPEKPVDIDVEAVAAAADKLITFHQAQQPPADASLEKWREYAAARGVADAETLNRSQIRSALGLSHFEG